MRSALVASAAAMAVFGGAFPAVAAEQEPRCTINDERLAEISGLASDGKRWFAVNDGGTRLEIFVLATDCATERVITAPVDPYDVEDLALAPDGTLWLADTGDNRKQRETVALHQVTESGQASLFRLTYPDGQHDAEALLLDRSGTPYIVTKKATGGSEVYRPRGEMSSPGPTPVEKVGEVAISSTKTPGGPVGTMGSVLVTGAATSHDGKVVALRTYTDAYLYPAPDSDVGKALQRDPVRIPLPDEEQGEAIAFDPDGTLLSVSEGAGQPVRAVSGAAAKAERAMGSSSGSASADGSAGAAGDVRGSGAETSVPAAPGLVIAIVVVTAAWLGLRKLARRP